MTVAAAVVPAKKSRKQQVRSKVTQDKLLDAAIVAFSESGYDGTSTRDIADRAGVHHPLITYHFSSKEILWKAAVGRSFDSCYAELGKTLSSLIDTTPKVRIQALLRKFVYLASGHPALHRVIVQESSHPNPRIDWISENYLQRFFKIVKGDLESLQADGIAPKGDVAILFNMMRMTGGAIFALSYEIKKTTELDLYSPDTIEEIIAMMTNIFLSGGII